MKRKIAHKAKAVLRRAKHRLASDSAVVTIPAQYNIDSPLTSRLESQQVSVEGWLIPHAGQQVKALRAAHAGTHHDVPYGLKRLDVAKAFPDQPTALTSGFLLELTADDGPLTIEADFGGGFIKLHEIDLRYSPEKLVADYYNPDLAQNMAEHLNLMDNKQQYFYEEPLAHNYKANKNDPRLMAFYLPQFHPIEQNNYVWGEGFTEWTNVTNDTPRFVGHRQPILPKDNGFYDLRFEQNIANQIDQAKKHGIHGFCFYYYWFSGERLLEKPLDSFLKHQDWDFNFAICWANENWTKRWDGRDNEVIIAQKYADDDPLKFIKDVEPILLDPRYIREDDKPVLIVFRAADLKQPEKYAEIWRDYFRKKHDTELHLVSILSFDDKDPRNYGFDAALDFAPQSSFFKNDAFSGGRYPTINVSDKLLDKNFSGTVANYREIALNKKAQQYFDFPIYKCVTPSWDNDARKKGKGFVMQYESPDVYGQWLDEVLANETQTTKSPLVFLNAWNEWAEGAILEPSMHYGSAVLNRTTEVLAKYSTDQQSIFAPFGIERKPDVELAVMIHMYYPERWNYLQEKLANLKNVKYDLFITLNEKDREWLPKILAFKKDANVLFVPNRGRDVLPFVHFARRLQAAGYSYVLKLHSKKSTHRDDGSEWFEAVVSNLLASPERVAEIMKNLQQGNSMIGPEGHLVSLVRHMGSNEATLEELLTRLYGSKKAKAVLKDKANYPYFGGTMFWTSLATIQPILDLQLMPEDFQSESGQIDGTTAHALERLFGIVAQVDGNLAQVSSDGITAAKLTDNTQKYKYAP